MHKQEVVVMSFGDRLQALRRSSGLTQEEFAQELKVSRQAVYKWESSRGYPEIEKIKEIMRDCGALGCAMTGSGSAVFGVCDAFDMAAMASMQLMETCKTYLARNTD